MKICAIICEYDPFHDGHAYQIERIKSEGYAVIAVMSGSFTQRGTAAVMPKYDRARAAVCGGADLVLELPFPYCAVGAARFADGATSLICDLGCADTLAFGSECGDTQEIIHTAKNMLSPEFMREVSEKPTGKRYAGAYSAAYEKMFGQSAALNGSNDLLAVEYVKSLLLHGSDIEPKAIKRVGQKYGENSGEGFASASSVRDMIACRDFEAIRKAVPCESAKLIEQAAADGLIADTGRLFLPYAAFLRLADPEKISGCAGVNDELATRLCESAKTENGLDGLIASAKTKLYSDSRIRRAILFSMLGVRFEDFSKPDFSVLLAANARGRKILAEIDKKSVLPIITKPADYRKSVGAEKSFELLLRAEALWTLATEKPRGAAYNMRLSPYISEE